MGLLTIPTLGHGLESWDAVFNAIINILVAGPFPLKEYADFASLPAAASYPRCVAMTLKPLCVWVSDPVGPSATPRWVPINGVGINHTSLVLSGTSTTWTAAFAAKHGRKGVAGRVTTAITASAGTTFDVGNHAAADPDMYAAGVLFALNMTFEDVATADPRGWSTTAQDVVVTCGGGGSFTAGVLSLYAFYDRTFAPPT